MLPTYIDIDYALTTAFELFFSVNTSDAQAKLDTIGEARKESIYNEIKILLEKSL